MFRMLEFVFKPSKEIKVHLAKEQEDNLQSPENIKICCTYDVVIAFDILLSDEVIGFAMFEKVTKRTFFLWDYAIDLKYQNKGYGTEALIQLAELLKKEYGIKKMTTTYIWGNNQAKRMYEKVGFTEMSVVDEPDCHEVNMKWNLKSKAID